MQELFKFNSSKNLYLPKYGYGIYVPVEILKKYNANTSNDVYLIHYKNFVSF